MSQLPNEFHVHFATYLKYLIKYLFGVFVY